jgi:hypothetical protein
MRLVQFCHNNSTRIGVEVSQNGDIVDISAVDASIASDTRSFLEAGDSALLAARRFVIALYSCKNNRFSFVSIITYIYSIIV